MADAILTLNAGSSSIKFSLFAITGPDRLEVASNGSVEGIGSAPHFVARDPVGTVLAEQRWPEADKPFQALLEAVLGWTETHRDAGTLVAVGHRVVHGGPDHDK